MKTYTVNLRKVQVRTDKPITAHPMSDKPNWPSWICAATDNAHRRNVLHFSPSGRSCDRNTAEKIAALHNAEVA